MAEAKVERAALIDLLTKTQRVAVVGTKKSPQVESCVITGGNGALFTTSIVRDGVSSIAQFKCLAESTGNVSIPVADISALLGALKAHSGTITLSHDNDRLRIKSAGKQTTLLSSAQAKAFAHSPKTVEQWAEESKERFGAVLDLDDPVNPMYRLRDGSTLRPSTDVVVDAADLHDALSASSINGQMVSSYEFEADSHDCVKVSVGDALKGGRTDSEVGIKSLKLFNRKKATVSGGLPFCLPSSGEIRVQFYDFIDHNAGVCMAFIFNGSTLFVREAAGA